MGTFSKTSTTVRIGRPRSFDREKALLRAVELFWTLGYESTTLVDLQKAMGGIKAPSFYAAFGSKEKLFYEAVEVYAQTQRIPVEIALTAQTTARVAIGAVLRVAADLVSQSGKPSGCLLVLGGINCVSANHKVQDHLRTMRSIRREVLLLRLKRGLREGDIPSGANLDAMAAFYTTLIDGLALQAKDGASRKSLRTTAESAMAAWDSFIVKPKPKVTAERRFLPVS